jgi:hypothetical protein
MMDAGGDRGHGCLRAGIHPVDPRPHQESSVAGKKTAAPPLTGRPARRTRRNGACGDAGRAPRPCRKIERQAEPRTIRPHFSRPRQPTTGTHLASQCTVAVRSPSTGVRSHAAAAYLRRCADRLRHIATYPREYEDMLQDAATHPREYGDRAPRFAAYMQNANRCRAAQLIATLGGNTSRHSHVRVHTNRTFGTKLRKEGKIHQ